MSDEVTIEDLVNRIQHGNTALVGELWERIYKFVHAKAHDMHAGDLTEDLEQECYFALLDAIDNFDGALGYKFLTYASHWFKQRMHRYMTMRGGGPVLPANLLPRLRKYRRIASEFQRDNGRKPSGAEVMAATGWTLDDLITVLENINADTTASLDAPLTDENEDFTLADTIAGAPDPADLTEETVFREQLRRDVWAAVDTLPAQQAEVLTRHYHDESTYKDIDTDMHLPDGKTRQLCAKGLRTLRSNKEITRQLRPYYIDLYGEGMRGGLSSFFHTRTSSTERAALLDMGEYARGK